MPNPDSQTFVNGRLITESEELRTGSRIILGNNHVFRFTNPEQGLNGVSIHMYIGSDLHTCMLVNLKSLPGFLVEMLALSFVTLYV